MFLSDADQLREARAFSKELESNVRRLARERDEARAAFAGAENSLAAEREYSARLSRECQERHDELRAEVERLRGQLEWQVACTKALMENQEQRAAESRTVAERQREACAVTVEKNVDALMLRKGLAEDVRDTKLVTEGDK